jgi:hypothetical protein
MNPPIKNIEIKGIKHASKELLKWPEIFTDHALRMNLFNLYIFIEIRGAGGGFFRYMYSRFLSESARITKNNKLLGPAQNSGNPVNYFLQQSNYLLMPKRTEILKTE